MCDYVEYAECKSQQDKTALDAWMEVCEGCEYGQLLKNYKGEVYGVICDLNGAGRDSYEISVESELPENCLVGGKTTCLN